MYRIPELLAPAGGMEQLKAAVENGADAVYMGGKLFNARINAANFSDVEMKEAIDYAHLRGVKLYVTMNTLIKDRELADALHYAAWLYEAGADALIIQNLGFAKLVREQIPGIDLHLSTQGTVYNAEGTREAKELGFSRVVLARELTLEEIKEITGENILDIEVFIHGALCICYSGQCQMSREIGGRSGNRGECAQPCRLPWSVYLEENGSLKETSASGFPLSPKDLCTVEQLGRLAEAGVASLKIEGRMKTPEYVAVVTGIYRKYLDLYAKYGKYKVDPADLADLSQIFSRGGFTEGYLYGNPKKHLMSGDFSKHQGIYIGKVTASSGPRKAAGGADPEKKGTRQRGIVTIKLTEKLSVGDGIEIKNRDLSGNLVTFMKRGDKKIDHADKGDTVAVGYIDGNISPGDRVFKISDKELMQRARASFEGKSGAAEKAMRKMEISFAFSAGLSKPISLTATDEEGNTVMKEMADGAEKAVNRSLTTETVTAQLLKTGGTPFRVASCTTDIPEGISIPLSRINELRRSVLEELEALHKKGVRKPVVVSWSLPAKKTVQRSSQEESCLYLYRADRDMQFPRPFSRIYVPYDAVLKGYFSGDDRIVPVIPSITKGWHDHTIRENFEKLVEVSARKGIAIGNLGWIRPFVNSGVNVFGDYGLNLFNSMDFQLAKSLGISEAFVSHEADIEDILAMDFHGVVPEVAVSGRIPVMISEHCLFASDLNFCGKKCEQTNILIKDRKGQLYPVITNDKDCRSVILSYKEANLSVQKEALKNAGIGRFRIYAE